MSARAALRPGDRRRERARSVQSAWVMMNTVRDTFSSIGDRSGEIARSVGSSTADLARSVGSSTADLARRVGSGTADLAREVGPRRALIGLAIAAVAIGGTIFVVRLLRARRGRDEVIDLGEEDLSAASRIIRPDEGMPRVGVRSPL